MLLVSLKDIAAKPMKMFRNQPGLKLVLPLAFLFVLTACIKDKYKPKNFMKPDWEQGFGVPVATFNVTLKNLITEDSTLIFNPDSSIKIAFAQDSLAEQSVADIIDIPAQAPTSQDLKLGVIDIDNFTTNRVIALSELVGNLSGPTAAAINAASGLTAPFPAMPEQAGGTYPMPALTEFSIVTFATGSLDFNLVNNYPTPLDSLVFELKNTGGASLGFARFGNVAIGATQLRSIPLAGKAMDNDIEITIVKILSSGNPIPSLISLASQLSIAVTGNNLTVIGGVVRIPSQDFAADTTDVDFATTDNEELYTIDLKDGRINFNFQSSISEPIRITVSMPGISKNNIPIRDSIDVASNATTSWVIDLTNSTIDLTTNTAQPYNQIQVIVQAKLISSGTLKPIDSSNAINVSYGFQNIDFSYIEGYFGQKNIVIDPGKLELDLAFLRELGGDFLFANPDVKLKISNSIGAPIRLGLNMRGISVANGNVDLNATPSLLPFPTIPNTSANGIVSFNNTNSQIAQLVSLPPDTITYGGNVLLNPAGNVGSNFLTDNSKIRIDMEMELPLELSAGNLRFADTSDFDGAGTFGESDGSGLQIVGAKLVLQNTNRFPFDINLDLTWLDSTGTQVYSTTVPFVQAAPVDANGRVNLATRNTATVDLNAAAIQNLKNAKRMALTFRMNTGNGGTTVAKLYTDYSLAIRILIEAKVKGLL